VYFSEELLNATIHGINFASNMTNFTFTRSLAIVNHSCSIRVQQQQLQQLSEQHRQKTKKCS
jgi:hypothetical protein